MLSGQKAKACPGSMAALFYDTGKSAGLICICNYLIQKGTILCFQKAMRKKFTHILWRLP